MFVRSVHAGRSARDRGAGGEESIRQRPHLVVLVLVLLAGAWPHLYAAFLWPESRDAVVWVTRSAVSSPGWAHWVFLDNHFVAYRPVTAFSYTLDSIVAGFDPLVYRLTDLAAHLGTAVALFVLTRRLAPRVSPWAAVAVAAVFVLHPASALVVPHLARRAYSLSTLFAASALAVYAGPSTRWRALGGAVLLALAALSNEAAYAAFPVAALVLWSRGALRSFAPAVVVAVLLVAVRMAIRGNVGGYAGDGGLFLPIVAATWTGVIGADVLRSDVEPLWSRLPAALLVGLVAAFVIPTFARKGPLTDEARASGLAWAWMIVLTLVFAPQGVFFPRQLYVVAAPYAVVVGLAFASRRTALVAVAATVLLLWQSPVVWGPDPVQRASWVRHDRLVRDIDAAVRELPLDATVLPVVPYFVRPDIERFRVRDEDERATGRQGFTWLSTLRGTKFTTPVSILHTATDPTPAATLERTTDGVVVRIPAGAEIESQPRDVTVDTLADGTRVVRPILDRGRHPPAYLYFHDGVAGSLVPLGDRR